MPPQKHRVSPLQWRVGLILGLVALSLYMLWPRAVQERVKGPNGEFVLDAAGVPKTRTVRRVNLKRGLDLQGGMYLALEPDDSKRAITNKTEALDNALRVIRNRIDEFGVAEPVIQRVGDQRIIVELPGIEDPKRAEEVVQKSAYLEFQITDKTQALEKVAPRVDAVLRTLGVGGADTAKAKVPASLDALLTTANDSASRDSVTLLAGADSAGTVRGAGALSRALQQGQIPGQYYVEEAQFRVLDRYLRRPEVLATLPPGKVLRWGKDSTIIGGRTYRELYVLDSRPIITGEYIVDAQPNSDPIEGNKVDFQLNNVGGRRFRSETARHIKDNMAIVLDERVMSAPVIQSAIGTRGQITMGGGDIQEAQDLALVLRAGALPVPLKVVDVRNIGASLGQDSIRKGIRAGLLAIVLVIAIMVIYYRFSGALAVGAMSIYVLYTLAILAGFDAVLTLPGLAGFILSIGLAVDENVLIFERIREELDRGKSVRLAIDEGFKHALPAIVDSSVTTILTAAVLYQYGTGPVRGFAVTLIAGIVASLFTGIFVSKTFYLLWLNRRAVTPETLSI